MRKTLNDLQAVLLSMHVAKVKRATLYVSPTQTLQVTEVGRWHPRERRLDFRITVGAPNYAERQWIKRAKKAGEPFPVKRVQLKYRPKGK